MCTVISWRKEIIYEGISSMIVQCINRRKVYLFFKNQLKYHAFPLRKQ